MPTIGPRRGLARLGRAALAALMLTAPVALTSGTQAQAHDTCNQPTNVRLATSPNIGSLPAGGPLTVSPHTNLIFTGVVHEGTKVHWGFYDPVTQHRYFRTTQPARDNCVVYQEPETIPASAIGPGTYEVWAIYIRWEDNPSHAETSRLVGTLVINQP